VGFERIDLLPSYNFQKARNARDRWMTPEGRALQESITERIRAGAGEDFLGWDFEKGKLGFLEDQWDLAGIQLFGEKITFPKDQDTFENIGFSHAHLYHGEFTTGCFYQTHFSFSRLYNMEFRECLFAFAHSMDVTLNDADL
jgi:hypothetical protein